MTEHNPPDEPEEPTTPDADPVTDEDLLADNADLVEESPAEETPIDDTVSEDDLLAAAEAPYEPPTEPAFTAAPPHQPSPPNQAPPYAQGGDGQPSYGQGLPTDRRLFRSRNDRKLGGVAGGIARYLGVDPTVVRIVFVVLALTGTSILVYLAAWILMPEHPSGQPEPVWRERATDRNLAIAVGLASLGLAVAILNESWLVLAIVLIAGGIWLLSEQPLAATSDWVSPVPPRPTTTGADDDAPAPAYTGAQFAYASAAPTSRNAGGWGWESSPPPPGPSDAIPTAPSSARGPQRITRGVFSLLAILAAVAIAASAGDWWDVSGTRMLGIAILIIGIGVLAGAVTRGGARGLIPLGILAILLLIPVTAVGGLVDNGVGSSTFRPLTLAELDETYSHGVGDLVVDLSGLDLDGETRNLDVDLGIGELTLLLPDEVGGTLDIENMAGEIIVNLPGPGNDFSSEGINQLPDAIRLPGDRGTLVLDVEVDFGLVEVRGN